jgi:uncharacterized protein with NRDE domain
MCLILFAWNAHPRYALIVAANREEFHRRDTAPAAFWDDHPSLLAGRDLQAGGTWLGLTRGGRFAAITNYREPASPDAGEGKSRGSLVSGFLTSDSEAMHHAEQVAAGGGVDSGFNMLLGDGRELAYVSNRGAGPWVVEPGCHGLSNHLLNTDWPKVHEGRERLRDMISGERLAPEPLFELLTDRRLTPGDIPDNVEQGLVPELMTRHYFIQSPEYGTRCSTVVLVGRDGETLFAERSFDPEGRETDTRTFKM